MSYDFFADGSDKIELLNYIFQETDLQIFDSYSPFDQEIRSYQKTEEIISNFDLESGGQFAVTFQIWSPNFQGKVNFKKIELDQKRVKGYKFRYATEGWGLIQLYFGGLQNNILYHSHIGHQSEKRASAWENTNPTMGKAIEWDWKEIASTSRKLKYHIHNKMAVRKIGANGILKGAQKLSEQGTILQ